MRKRSACTARTPGCAARSIPNGRNVAYGHVSDRTKQTTRGFLVDFHRRYQLDGVTFLVDAASYLGPVLAEDGYRFQILSHGNRNAIKRVFKKVERRTFSFANIFVHVDPETAENWLEAFVVHHSARQT